MNRRWFGVFVVVGVLLAAVLGADPLTRRVAGHPAVLTVPGAPLIGDCVLALQMAERGAELEETIDYPAAEYGPCEGPVLGEVSSVAATSLPARRLTWADYWPLSAQCALDAIGYTGSIPPVVQQGAGRPGILWKPSVSIAYTPVGPNAAQRALGQQWSACVVGSVDRTPYDGRLHEALSSGILPSVFGSCWPAGYDRSARETPCNQPHVAELLGDTEVGMENISADDLRVACGKYAARVLRTADPTRQGGVVLDIVDDDRVFPVLPSAENSVRDRSVSCFATAPAGSRFNGTLVGIGDGPLPLVR